MTMTPSAFRKDPEDLVREVREWIETEGVSLGLRAYDRVRSLCDALAEERESRAVSAGIIRDQNVSLGELERQLRALEGIAQQADDRVAKARSEMHHHRLLARAQSDELIRLQSRPLVRVQAWLDERNPIAVWSAAVAGVVAYVRR